MMVSFNVSWCEGVDAALETLHTEERVVFWLVNCKDGLALLEGEFDAIFLKISHYFGEFVTIEAAL